MVSEVLPTLCSLTRLKLPRKQPSTALGGKLTSIALEVCAQWETVPLFHVIVDSFLVTALKGCLQGHPLNGAREGRDPESRARPATQGQTPLKKELRTPTSILFGEKAWIPDIQGSPALWITCWLFKLCKKCAGYESQCCVTKVVGWLINGKCCQDSLVLWKLVAESFSKQFVEITNNVQLQNQLCKTLMAWDLWCFNLLGGYSLHIAKLYYDNAWNMLESNAGSEFCRENPKKTWQAFWHVLAQKWLKNPSKYPWCFTSSP